MSRFSWILLILLVILAVSQLWMMDNREAPSGRSVKKTYLCKPLLALHVERRFKLENSESLTES